MKTQVLSVTFDDGRLVAEYDSSPLGSECVVAQVLVEIAQQISLDPSSVIPTCQLLADEAMEMIRKIASQAGIET